MSARKARGAGSRPLNHDPALLPAGTSGVDDAGGTAPTTRRLLAEIQADTSIMLREQLDEDAIEEYATKFRREARGELRAGEQPFPPCVVFTVAPDRTVLAHGWHRFEAMRKAEITAWEFDVHQGTLAEAATYAARANQDATCVRFTNSDKRNACRKLFAVLGNVSSRVVADLAGVDHKTAEKYRPAESKTKPRRGRDNKSYGPQPSPAEPSVGEIPQLSPVQMADFDDYFNDGGGDAAILEPALLLLPSANETNKEPPFVDHVQPDIELGTASEATHARHVLYVGECRADAPTTQVFAPVDPDAADVLAALGAATMKDATERIAEIREQERSSRIRVEQLHTEVAKLARERDALLTGGALGELLRNLGAQNVEQALATIRELRVNADALRVATTNQMVAP